MTTDKPQQAASMMFANDIINLANASLEKGLAVEELAEGMRHAAANFSAYCFFRTEQSPKDPNDTVENFVKFFEYYLDVHNPKEDPAQGLAQTIAQAKSEL
ncbi:MAG: DUF3144 domain-containing protein [Rhodospirillales bacterium]|nr:DUF3144 domain-containing protein [Rhodospirillales bacterium]